MELLAEFVRGREQALQYRQTGSLLLAVDKDEQEKLHARFLVLREAGLNVQWLNGTEALALEPEISSEVLGASYSVDDAQVDPAALADAWLEDAVRHGAEREEGRRVEHLVFDSDRGITGVWAGDRIYKADTAVIAAGVWSSHLLADAGLPSSIRPRRGMLLWGEAGTRLLARRPLLGGAYLEAKYGEGVEIAMSLQQHPRGHVVLGGSREYVGFSEVGARELREEVLDCARRYLPWVDTVPWDRHTFGFRPATTCGEPLVGRTDVPGLYLATGHEGDGITLAAGTAERVALLVETE
jgi:sarcosine oxidase subunit beta